MQSSLESQHSRRGHQGGVKMNSFQHNDEELVAHQQDASSPQQWSASERGFFLTLARDFTVAWGLTAGAGFFGWRRFTQARNWGGIARVGGYCAVPFVASQLVAMALLRKPETRDQLERFAAKGERMVEERRAARSREMLTGGGGARGQHAGGQTSATPALYQAMDLDGIMRRNNEFFADHAGGGGTAGASVLSTAHALTQIGGAGLGGLGNPSFLVPEDPEMPTATSGASTGEQNEAFASGFAASEGGFMEDDSLGSSPYFYGECSSTSSSTAAPGEGSCPSSAASSFSCSPNTTSTGDGAVVGSGPGTAAGVVEYPPDYSPPRPQLLTEHLEDVRNIWTFTPKDAPS